MTGTASATIVRGAAHRPPTKGPSRAPERARAVRRRRGIACFGLAMLGTLSAGLPAAPIGADSGGAAAGEVLISVDATTITREEFARALAASARQRFYHGTPPAAALAALRREVAEALIMRVLLLRECERRGMRPDAAAVAAELDKHERRYAADARWQQQRPQLLPALGKRLAEDDMLRRLETSVRAVAEPDEPRLQRYYAQHRDKFTEPARQRVSVLLLKVPAHAAAAEWELAAERAAALATRISAGEDFAELARRHSDDPSAPAGGDMGYLHQGMLSPTAEALVAALPLGELSAPIRLLEGMALFRVTAREVSVTRDYAEVRERVRGLWQREQSDAAWRTFTTALRARAAVQIMDPALAPTPPGEPGGDAQRPAS